jgi:hypothetical protein
MLESGLFFSVADIWYFITAFSIFAFDFNNLAFCYSLNSISFWMVVLHLKLLLCKCWQRMLWLFQFDVIFTPYFGEHELIQHSFLSMVSWHLRNKSATLSSNWTLIMKGHSDREWVQIGLPVRRRPLAQSWTAASQTALLQTEGSQSVANRTVVAMAGLEGRIARKTRRRQHLLGTMQLQLHLLVWQQQPKKTRPPKFLSPIRFRAHHDL